MNITKTFTIKQGNWIVRLGYIKTQKAKSKNYKWVVLDSRPYSKGQQ